MIGVYEAIIVGVTMSFVVGSLFRYLIIRRTFGSTEELWSQHQKEMIAVFTDTSERIRASSRETIEQIKQHGEETRERIGQYAEEAIRSMSMEAED